MCTVDLSERAMGTNAEIPENEGEIHPRYTDAIGGSAATRRGEAGMSRPRIISQLDGVS